MKKYALGLILLLSQATLLEAKPTAVQHEHNGRSHSHLLPATGLSHSHNQGNSTKALDGWYYVMTTVKGNSFYLKEGSGKVSSARLNKPIAIAISQTKTKSGTITLEKNYVTKSACANKMGKIVTLSLDDTYLYKNDFIFGVTNPAAHIAEVLCSLFSNNNEE